MPLALDPAVMVQLINLENGYCWQATLSGGDINTSTEFRGKSDEDKRFKRPSGGVKVVAA